MKPKVYIIYPVEAVGSIQSYVTTCDCNGMSYFSFQSDIPWTVDNANDIEEKPEAEPRCQWRCRRIGISHHFFLSYWLDLTRCYDTE